MKLTDREDQIFGMVRSGLTSRQIGVRLGISSRTVDEHRQSCKLKLGGGNVVEQVAKYRGVIMSDKERDYITLFEAISLVADGAWTKVNPIHAQVMVEHIGVLEAKVARYEAAFIRIKESSDSEMLGGDLARDIADDMLTKPTKGDTP